MIPSLLPIITAPLVRDPDTRDYIRRVEAADGQALEPMVRRAIDAFVRGCKADDIWPAIKASCIMAGARTLAGALTPLVGAAPTNFNFVAGDYNRKTGLKGDGSTKYLDSNRNNNAEPQNSKHIACYAPVAPLGSAVVRNSGPSVAIEGINTGGSGLPMNTQSNNNDQIFRVNGSTTITAPSAGLSIGLRGVTRASSSTITGRIGGVNYSGSSASETPQSGSLYVFARNLGGSGLMVDNHINFPLAFYSIGESLDLALLDARVTTLMNAIGAALP